jgi:hypothetical protein
MKKVFTWRLFLNAAQKTEVMLFQVLATSSDEAKRKLLEGPFLSKTSLKNLASEWIDQTAPVVNEPDEDCWVLQIEIGIQTTP